MIAKSTCETIEEAIYNAIDDKNLAKVKRLASQYTLNADMAMYSIDTCDSESEISIDIVKFLLYKTPYISQNMLQSMLSLAVYIQNISIIQAILDRGAQITDEIIDEIIARTNQHEQVKEFILSKLPTNEKYKLQDLYKVE